MLESLPSEAHHKKILMHEYKQNIPSGLLQMFVWEMLKWICEMSKEETTDLKVEQLLWEVSLANLSMHDTHELWHPICIRLKLQRTNNT